MKSTVCAFSVLLLLSACKREEVAKPGGAAAEQPVVAEQGGAQGAVDPKVVASELAKEATAAKPKAERAQPPVANQAPKTAPRADSLYIDRELTEADVAKRTLRELSLMRNTIFARHGNTFVKPWLDVYFRAQPWYEGKPKKRWGKPSARDLANAAQIARHESKLTAQQLDKRASEVLQRLEAKTTRPHDHLELRLLSARRGKWLGGDVVPKNKRTPLEDPSLLGQQLVIGQIEAMSRRDLRLLRNTIYALHGYVFRSELLLSYFSTTDWYKERPDFHAKQLTAVDQRNLKLIRSLEDVHGGPLSDSAHADAIGWFGGA